MIQTLSKRYSYDELKLLAHRVPKGTIILNIDKRPVAFKHPWEEEILFIGYRPNSYEITFARYVEYGLTARETEIIVEPTKIISSWNDFKDDKFNEMISVLRPETKEFFQYFMFMNGYTWDDGTTELKEFDDDDIAYITLYTSSYGDKLMKSDVNKVSRNMPFISFWKSYFKFN